MKQNRIRLFGGILTLLTILLYQISFTVVQNVLPYPSTFGRETTVGTATKELAPMPLEDGSLAYLQGESLVIVSHTARTDQTVKKLPLPAPTFKDTRQFRMFTDCVFWVSDNRLYRCKLVDGAWGEAEDLGTATAFDAVKGKDGMYLTASDDRQVRICRWIGEQMSIWYSTPIQDVTELKSAVTENGNLIIASLSESGSLSRTFWWTEWDSSRAAVVKQSKIFSVQTDTHQSVGNLQLGLQQSEVCLFFTQASAGTGGKLHTIRFPLDNPAKLQAQEIAINGPVYGMSVTKGENGFAAVMSLHQTIHLLKLADGQKITDERISEKISSSILPVFAVNDETSPTTVVWLQHKKDGMNSVQAVSDDPVYREKMNRLRFADFAKAVTQLPSLLTGSLFALAASLKWLVLPFFYLGIARLFKKSLNKRTPVFHFIMAAVIYLVVKAAFISQFHSSETSVEMPVWMTYTAAKYLLVPVIAGISALLSGTIRLRDKAGGQSERLSAVRMFTAFALTDVIITALWYGYFIR